MVYITSININKGIYMNQFKYTNDVINMLKTFGERIRTARIRRRWSMENLGERINVSRRTVARIENGDPGVSLGIFLTALWVLGLWNTVGNVAEPSADKVGEHMERIRQPKRVHRQQEEELDF